jgi:hypothetical protein
MLRSPARNLTMLPILALAAACSGAGATPAGGKVAAPGASAPGAAAPNAAAPAAGSRAIPARDLALSPGTTLELRSRTALSSRTNHVGDPVSAVLVAPAYADSGTVVIPAGSELLGTVEAIAPAPNPHSAGRLELAFTEVRVAGTLQPIHARVVSIATHLKGRGVTGGTVAKVGAGALIGGIAGRIIGRSTAGTVIGAAAGGAAGGVYANATRNLDVMLDRGAPIRLELTEPFTTEVAMRP